MTQDKHLSEQLTNNAKINALLLCNFINPFASLITLNDHWEISETNTDMILLLEQWWIHSENHRLSPLRMSDQGSNCISIWYDISIKQYRTNGNLLLLFSQMIFVSISRWGTIMMLSLCNSLNVTISNWSFMQLIFIRISFWLISKVLENLFTLWGVLGNIFKSCN